MAQIVEDYISFKTAKLLKEKGFDEKCQKVYMHNGQLLWAQIFMEGESFVNNECIDLVAKYNNWVGSDYAFLCPTLQMAMKWLREVHNIHISVYPFNRELPITENTSYTCDVATTKDSPIRGHLRGTWKTYEEALEDAIRYCLKNLI